MSQRLIEKFPMKGVHIKIVARSKITAIKNLGGILFPAFLLTFLP